MHSVDGAICVACGNELGDAVRSSYPRCDECIAVDRPHSLVVARRVRSARRLRAYGGGEFDPVGRTAA